MGVRAIPRVWAGTSKMTLSTAQATLVLIRAIRRPMPGGPAKITNKRLTLVPNTTHGTIDINNSRRRFCQNHINQASTRVNLRTRQIFLETNILNHSKLPKKFFNFFIILFKRIVKQMYNSGWRTPIHSAPNPKKADSTIPQSRRGMLL